MALTFSLLQALIYDIQKYRNGSSMFIKNGFQIWGTYGTHLFTFKSFNLWCSDEALMALIFSLLQALIYDVQALT